MRMAKVPYAVTKKQSEIVALRGNNWSDALTDGDLAESRNLSTRRYPYIAARNAREERDTAPKIAAAIFAASGLIRSKIVLKNCTFEGNTTTSGDGYTVVGGEVQLDGTEIDKLYADLVSGESYDGTDLFGSSAELFGDEEEAALAVDEDEEVLAAAEKDETSAEAEAEEQEETESEEVSGE